MSDGTYSTQNLQIHLSQNQGGDTMLNFLVKTEESWFYDVKIVRPFKFFLNIGFRGLGDLKIRGKDRT